ncbi:Transcription factor bHLH18 [Glycine soja]
MNSLEEELKEEINYSCDSIFTAVDNRNNVGNLSSFEENNTQHANSSSEKPTSLFSSYTLSFEDCTTVPNVPNKTCQYHGEHEHLKETREETHTRKCKRGTKTCQTQDHIIVVRKRRENLTRMFVALSAIIPGLKNVSSVIPKFLTCDVTNYKMKHSPNVEDFSWIYNGLDGTKTFPHVEARVSAKDVLIRVICDKEIDIVTKLLSKLAAHNLSIVCSNVVPFGNSTLKISMIAKVHANITINVKIS